MSTDITQATEKTPTDAPETAGGGGGGIYRPLTDIVETDQGARNAWGRRRCGRNHTRKPRADDSRQG